MTSRMLTLLAQKDADTVPAQESALSPEAMSALQKRKVPLAEDVEVLNASSEGTTNVIQPTTVKDLCRTVAALISQGNAPSDIAKILHREEAEIKILIRQPLTMEYINELSDDNHETVVENVLQTTVLDSIFELVRLRDSETSSPSIKLRAATELLDRALGKPLSADKITLKNRLPSPTDPKEEAEQLQQEIKRIEDRIKRHS